jgi:Flp pilus assembly protein TadG
MVEAAIVLPVLVFLIFAMIDFSWTFYEYISLRQGVREAAREDTITTRPGDGTWVAKGCALATNNIPSPQNTTTAGQDFYDMMCYAKDRIGLGMGTGTRISIAWNSSESQNWAPTTLTANFDSLVVCAQYQVTSLTGALGTVLNHYVVTAKTEIRIEQPSVDILGASPTLANSGPIAEQALSSWPASCQSA